MLNHFSLFNRRTHNYSLILAVLLLVALLGAVTVYAQEGATEPTEVRAFNSVRPIADSVGVYDKFEAVIDLDATFNNPYDPNDIQLDGEFTSPSGATMLVPGFYYQEFRVSPGNTLDPGGAYSWRVRFAPTEVGEWSYQVLATTASGTLRSDSQTFTATESDNPGFVRVDPRNPRYFAFDNGTTYFPVGENVGWSTGTVLNEYQMWMDALANSNSNFMRVWMASWGFGIEWTDTGLGDYTRRQNRAFMLDRVLDMAADRGIYIMLSLLNHGAFSETTNPEWSANPYNATNGGPLASPGEFATNEEAARFWHQRLRYIAARWGYSTNIMTWEWWNEVNWTPLASGTVLGPWIERSAAYLETLDPYDHLMTTSGSPEPDRLVWDLPALDFTQDHRYNMNDLERTFNNVIPEWVASYPDKPFLMGEFGISDGADSSDSEGILLHQGLWSAPMNGAAGTAMTWWWDSWVHPNNLYYHFGGISAYFAGEDMGARQWLAATATVNVGFDARVYGLQTPDYGLLWVVNRDYSQDFFQRQYIRNLRNQVENPLDIEFPDLTDVTLTVTGMNDGDYTVELWDTFTGIILESSTVTFTGGTATIPLPTFNRDVAVKIKS